MCNKNEHTMAELLETKGFKLYNTFISTKAENFACKHSSLYGQWLIPSRHGKRSAESIELPMLPQNHTINFLAQLHYEWCHRKVKAEWPTWYHCHVVPENVWPHTTKRLVRVSFEWQLVMATKEVRQIWEELVENYRRGFVRYGPSLRISSYQHTRLCWLDIFRCPTFFGEW